MPRIKIDLPKQISFSCIIPIRISDINYGGHVGNDAILSILHEARLQFLNSFGWTEMNFGGVSLIMSDVGIEFKGEAFYGEIITALVVAGDPSRVGFDLYYKLVKKTSEKEVVVALAKTGMICFDYKSKKVASLPDTVKPKLFFP
ncbi:MAG TPA: thioesterase family protein [Flavisolibacter sp.]|nr:thioesterase family protein [Flavisolibacter sp.]